MEYMQYKAKNNVEFDKDILNALEKSEPFALLVTKNLL